MASTNKTANYNLNQWLGTDNPKREDFNSDNFIVDDELKNLNNSLDLHTQDYKLQIPYGGTTTNTGNIYTIASPVITILEEGMAISFKINANSTGAVSLNWSATGNKSVLAPDGTAITDWKINSIYTVRYNGTNFILQGEGGYRVTGGNFLVYSNTSLSTTTNLTPTKLKSASVVLGGTYRVAFSITSPSTTFTTYARIYVNDVAVGIQRDVFNGTLSFTEDIPNIKKGDQIQIYVWKSAGSGSASISVFNLQTNNLVTTIL